MTTHIPGTLGGNYILIIKFLQLLCLNKFICKIFKAKEKEIDT